MAIRKDIDDDFPIFIYGLIDPRTDKIRYVGWCQILKRRYSEHLSDARLGDKGYKNNWIRKLLANELKPEMVIIEETIYSLRIEKEQYWIKYYGRENLTNGTDGGEGNLGWIPSQEWRDNASKRSIGRPVPWLNDKPKSEEHKRKLSESHKGLQKGEKNPFFGKHHTEETKEKLRQSHLGKPSKFKGVSMSEENKKKISIAKKAKMNDQIRENISKGLKGLISKALGTKKNIESSSKYIGVYWHTQSDAWRARITIDQKRKHLGNFKLEIDAAKAYDKKCYELYGDKAKLNFPEDYNL